MEVRLKILYLLDLIQKLYIQICVVVKQLPVIISYCNLLIHRGRSHGKCQKLFVILFGNRKKQNWLIGAGRI